MVGCHLCGLIALATNPKWLLTDDPRAASTSAQLFLHVVCLQCSMEVAVRRCASAAGVGAGAGRQARHTQPALDCQGACMHAYGKVCQVAATPEWLLRCLCACVRRGGGNAVAVCFTLVLAQQAMPSAQDG